MLFNVAHIRQEFRILRRRVNGHPLVYLDNASTTQKPRGVISAITKYYSRYNANIHRGIHTLSEEATAAYEATRKTVARFINASPEEIIFTRNATESINLVAYAWGRANIKKGDAILTTQMEHHSNLLPWHALAQEKGAELRVAPIAPSFSLSLTGRGQGEGLFRNIKLLALTHMSNVLGTINLVEEIIKQAHKAGTLVLVDAAQSAAHIPLDVKKMDCDFLVFSSHKMYGPTGVGVLYGKRELLEKMSPFLYGGDMVKAVKMVDGRTMSDIHTSVDVGHRTPAGGFAPIWNDLPWKFEAGTGNIADVIGFGAALEFIKKIGWENIQAHEKKLMEYGWEKLSGIDGLTMYGPDITPPTPSYNSAQGGSASGGKRGSGGVNLQTLRGPIFSFNLDGIHAHDVASVLNDRGIAIRSGHHCAMPLHEHLGVPATARASLAVYNTIREIDKLCDGIRGAIQLFQRKDDSNGQKLPRE